MSEDAPKHVYEILVRASADEVWHALTDPDLTERYYFGMRISSPLTSGAPYAYTYAGDGSTGVAGQVLESSPGVRLVTTFRAFFDQSSRDEPESRVTYELERNESGIVLRLIHDDLADSPATSDVVAGGWPGILFGLQALFLERDN